MAEKAHCLADSRRLVVKIGSALLVDDDTGRIRNDWLDALADDIAAGRGKGQEVVIVSSGAIAAGRRDLGLAGARLRLEEKQAAAAAGQIRLAHAYQDSLARHNLRVAQALLSLEDTERRRRHLNARNTLETLLRLGAVPIINENDTVATEEIRVGDNDRLAARVAQMISADTLVLMTDIDGLYTTDPRRDPSAEPIPVVRAITPEIEAMAGTAPVGMSSGGMVTKIQAARIALNAGCRMVIVDGRAPHALAEVDRSERHTWFLPGANSRTQRKKWIASVLNPLGAMIVDDGAVKALSSGKSLLPAGVVEIRGDFERGDAIIVHDRAGNEIARGLAAYAATEAHLIAGHKSDEIEGLLGYRGRDEMVHRDDLVLS
ncbi:MAG: glutamate 5-kinase [Alphaproteobacteria bacterium]|nr:glutamate 5-kinase [Alphaproteobacteria bacterium]